jgi:hypothetical protein
MPNDFDMPRVLNNGRAAAESQRAIEEALAQPLPQPAPQLPYAPPPRPPIHGSTPSQPYSAPKTPTHVETIKERLKQLTHREMRDLVKEIFDVHQNIRADHIPPTTTSISAVEAGFDAITQSQLPDILDKLAHGD